MSQLPRVPVAASSVPALACGTSPRAHPLRASRWPANAGSRSNACSTHRSWSGRSAASSQNSDPALVADCSRCKWHGSHSRAGTSPAPRRHSPCSPAVAPGVKRRDLAAPALSRSHRRALQRRESSFPTPPSPPRLTLLSPSPGWTAPLAQALAQCPPAKHRAPPPSPPNADCR